MDTETMIRNLKKVEDDHKDDKVFTGQLNISEMAHDVRKRLEELKPYEDTGLDPEQIMELKERNTAKAPIKDTDSGVRYTDDYICPKTAESILLGQELQDFAITAARGLGGRTDMQKKKILDVTCGSRTIWFNKHHPAAVYCDIRREEYSGIWKSVKGRPERKCVIDPDIKCDFTNLPFPDESFSLVVFDPPHLKDVGDNARLAKIYGKLETNWPQMLHEGFRECMRVLKPDGVLIFKWSEYDIPAADVWKAIGEKPLFGHHSGKNSKTFWGCYMKGVV